MTTDNGVSPQVTASATPGAASVPASPAPGAAVAVSPTTEQPKAPEPSAEDILAEKILAKLAPKLEAEYKRGEEQGIRKYQSTKDRETLAERQRAEQAEARLNAISARLRQEDPAAADTIELETLRMERQQAMQTAQQQQTEAGRQKFYNDFIASQRARLADFGIDPDDKRIDWASDAPDYSVANDRILASAAKVRKELDKARDDKRTQEIKDLEAKLRRDLGIDSVDTSISTGAAVDGIPTDRVKFAQWIKENPDEYREKRAKVKEMQAKGLIR